MTSYNVQNSFASPEVAKLVMALPPDGTNPVGYGLRDHTVNYLKRILPGKKSKKNTWRSVFYPEYTSSSPEELLPDIYETAQSGNMIQLTEFGINNSKVINTPAYSNQEFSMALLCQRGVDLSKNMRKMVNASKVSSHITSSNDYLKLICFSWYGQVAQSQGNQAIGQAMEAFNTAEKKQSALNEYLSGLTSESWINAMTTLDAQGKWINPEWDMYHHYIKLYLLGADEDTISDTITKMITGGLKIPATVIQNTYRTYNKWYEDLSGDDFSAADDALNHSKTPRGMFLPFKNDYFYDYTSSYGSPAKMFKK